MPALSNRQLALLLTFSAVPAACSDTHTGTDATVANDAALADTSPGDAAVSDALDRDASDAAPDAPLPPGPAGDILRIPATGHFHMPTLSAAVQVVHTEADIPHVYAVNERDATVALGFLAARDRYFQIELERRLGLGTLSQLLGDKTLAADQASRGRGTTFIATRLLAQMQPAMLDRLDAYAEGINAWIDAAKAGTVTLPNELPLAGPLLGARRPTDILQPWSRQDVAAILAVVLNNSSFTTDDLDRSTVAAGFDALFTGAPHRDLRLAGLRTDLFDYVKPVRAVTSAAGYGLEQGTTANATRRAPRMRHHDGSPPVHVAPGVIERAVAALRPFAPGREHGRRVDFGSNAWAVSSRGTMDGGALLAGDGHLGLSVPTLLYQAGIDTSVFGGGAQTQLGLYFPGIPLMGLGTNGHVAWSFTYLYGDLTDWYAEEIQLDASGAPSASRFQGSFRPLVSSTDTYTIANVPALGSVGRTEMWNRWTTFDGRWIVSVEGRPVTAGVTPGAGETVVEMLGQKIIPADVDHDGRITAVSFDYTGFDVSDILRGLDGFAHASTVDDMRAAQHRFVGFAQNFVSADEHGHIHYSGYTGTPCRTYLPHDGDHFRTGADPRRLIDGTQYGSFTVPLGSDGLPDESMNATPASCVIPFADWPSARDPDRGYVLTSNNDLNGNAQDNNLANDRYYLGGPWDPGYRAQTISDSLAADVTAHRATVDTMAGLQADHHSMVGRQFVPFLQSVITDARALAAATGTHTPEETRLIALYNGDSSAIDDVSTRLAAWLTRGANAASGVETFYDSPTAGDRSDAVATMIFDSWFRSVSTGVFGDEGIDAAIDLDPRFIVLSSLTRLVAGRGAGNSEHLASFDPSTGESAFWDDVTTADMTESSREIALRALVRALATLRAAPSAPGVGGFGTSDANQWLWGLRHQVVLDSIIKAYAGDVQGVEVFAAQGRIGTSRLPLATGIPASDPRHDLTWFPRPGDLVNVDAANPPWRGDAWTYATGPVMRMVVSLNNGQVHGQNVIPAGQSGIATSPHFADQAALWLGNRALPMRYTVSEVVANATARESFER